MKKIKNNELLVTFIDDDEVANEDVIAEVGGKTKKKVFNQAMKHFGHRGFTVIEVADVDKAIAHLKKHPKVKSVSPNYIVNTQAYPNDPMFNSGELWGMNNIKAAQAWATNKGSQKIFVGLIDEGIMYWHPDLCGQIWTNPFETKENSVDDDGNGYVDDMHGWDFYNNDNSIFDASDKHGTHTAGTIGAKGDNGEGVIGVCPNVTIISSKFLQGFGSVDASILAIDYLTDLKIRHGLNIVCMSNSWGYEGGFIQELFDAVERARMADILFICAAGNAAADSDTRTFYPASLPNDNVISVAAIDINDNLASFSNWGAKNVDLGAPGVGIWSTNYDDDANPIYANFSGTSMACPHVAGAAALYKSGHPAATYQEVKAAILNSVRKIPALTGKCTTGGTLDVSTFGQGSSDVPELRECPDVPTFDLTPPTQVKNIRCTEVGSNYLRIEWDASQDPESGVYFYGIYAYQGGILFQSITTFNTYIVHGALYPGVEYCYQIWAINKSGKMSPVSDTFCQKTAGEPDVTPPGVPQNVRLTEQSATRLSFAWDVPDDNFMVSGYFVEMFDETMEYSVRGTTNSTSITAGGLPTGVKWHFHVKAHDPAGNYSEYSEWLYAETIDPAPDTEKPTVPTNLRVVAGQNSLSFSWSPSSDNVGVAGYNVYIDSVETKVNGTSYTFANLLPDKIYHLAVSAYDKAGNTSDMATMDGKTLPPPPPTESITLSGTTNGENRNLSWTITGGNAPFIELQQWAKGGWTVVKMGDATFTSYAYTQRGKKKINWRVKADDGGVLIYSNEIEL